MLVMYELYELAMSCILNGTQYLVLSSTVAVIPWNKIKVDVALIKNCLNIYK